MTVVRLADRPAAGRQVEQDEGVRIELVAVQVVHGCVAVVAQPGRDQRALDEDEAPGPEHGRDPVGDPCSQRKVVVEDLVGGCPVMLAAHGVGRVLGQFDRVERVEYRRRRGE